MHASATICIVVALLACSDDGNPHAAPDGGRAGSAASAGAGGNTGGSAGTRPGPTDAAVNDAAARDAATNPGTKRDAAVPAGGHDAAASDDDAGSQPDAAAASGKPFVYVSGYGSTIHIFELDPQNGTLTARGTADGGKSPSYLAFAPNHETLYAIDEASPPDSEVIAFAIDQRSGALSEINRAASGGGGSPHLAVDPSGKWIAVAHYDSGHTTILPVRSDGGVGNVVATKRGPNDDCVRAHQAVFDRSGTHLFVPCLDSSYVQQFKLNPADGSLSYNDPPTVAVSGGPRHLAFDPSEQHAYVLSETASTITWFDYDATSGKLSNPQVIDSFQTTKGSSAQIVVHPSGGFLYASNRGEDSLGLFSLDATGRPMAKSFITDMIEEPRDFTVDPSGRFLLSANQQGAQNVMVFRIAAQSGALSRVQVVPVGDQPSFVGVLLLPGG
jgi:6-phosphogluconolactonase